MRSVKDDQATLKGGEVGEWGWADMDGTLDEKKKRGRKS
jgi:hypothetical protein